MTIPNFVTIIENYAFTDCSGLTSLTIPSSVTTIENYSFSGCFKLIKIINLSGVTLTASICPLINPGQEILTSVEEDFVNELSDYDVNGIQTFTVGSMVYLFSYNGSEANLDLSSYTNINAFYQFALSDNIQLTSVIFPNNLQEIKMGAFKNCSGLTSITIPNSVTIIEAHTFYGCSSLLSVIFSENVTELGYSSFSGC